MDIRFAEPKDLEQIVQLCKSHAEYEKAAYVSADKKEKLSKALFKSPEALKCLVVEQDNQLFGYATFMKQYSTWDAEFYIYLDCVYLTAETRGQGIGRKVMHQVRAYAVQEYCKLIQWQTPEFNNDAITFYKSLGATSKTKERFFWGV